MRTNTHKRLNLLRINTKLFFHGVVVVLLLVTGISFYQNDDSSFSKKLNEAVINQFTLIIQNIDSIAVCLDSQRFNKKKAIKHYEKARRLFKQIEFYTEYFYSFHSKYFINGALVNKAEYEYGYKTFVPHGFQVLENYLYPTNTDSTINIKYELNLLKQTFSSLQPSISGKKLVTATTVDMLRFELVRIMSLYLNGYDCTINKQNIKEIKYIFEGFEKTIKLIEVDQNKKDKIHTSLKASVAYLNKNTNFDNFNRLFFITNYIKPLYEQLYSLYETKDKTETTSYAINIRQKLFYDAAWLNSNYFSVILSDSLYVRKQAELGKLLFFDPILSSNAQRACASCHSPENGFGGKTAFDKEFELDNKLKRNTPSLLNCVFQKSFFHDGRSLQLEDQVSDVLLNHKEMFSIPESAINKLQQSEEYRKLFSEAFKNSEDTVITFYSILKSISEFERKLITLNSRFDKYLRGDQTQLNAEEIHGYSVFAGKALCGSCHFFPLFNGLVPPFYSENEFEVIGVPKDKSNTALDGDSGRYFVSKNKIHLASFKTPGIRNIDKTAPYMHNGVYENLDEILEFYVKGGGAGLGIDVPNQTLPFDSLQLSKKEISNLKKFILSLTDNSFQFQAPKRLPTIKGFENRKIGGNY